MDLKDNPSSKEESTYTPYPSLERAEENYKYRLFLYGEGPQKKTKKTTKTSKKSDVSIKDKESLVKLMKAAKLEESLDDSAALRPPVGARKALIDRFMTLNRNGVKLSEKQVQYIKNFFYWHPEAVKSKYIRFLISATIETSGYPAAAQTANELANALEDTKYEEPLREYGRWLTKKSMVVKITELKKAGMNHTEIGEKLNISSAQVAVLADSKDEKYIFHDLEQR